MMPFSVLRMWGFGLLSWCVLGAGVYLISEWSERVEQAPVVAEVADRNNDRPVQDDAASEPVRPTQTRQRADDDSLWYLIGGLALVSLSFFGFLPIGMVLSRWSPVQTSEPPPARQKELWVDRPDGSRLHVQVYGDASQPTLILTHGWTLDASNWDYVLGSLARQYRVVTWDLPGLGQSHGPRNRDFSIEKMANDLEAVLKATATKMPIVLAGHSIGGMITQTFCRLHEEHLGTTVQGLIFVHTTYTNPLRTAIGGSLWSSIESPVIVPLNYLTIGLAPLVWLSNWMSYLNGSLHFTSRFTSFTGKQTWAALDHSARLAAKAWPAVVARGNLAMLDFNEERTLPKVEIPVLVVSGEHDRMTLPTASLHIERLLASSRPFQLNSGHLGFWELPGDFQEVATQFTEQVTSGRGGKSAVATEVHASATENVGAPRLPQ
jgi:pimeloyl-ACP methyl ester carboxylesterase